MRWSSGETPHGLSAAPASTARRARARHFFKCCLAGSGAITAVILLTDNDVYSVHERAETAVVLLVVLALNYLLLLLSDVILRIIGRQGAAILTRVMGIILTALSVEFVLAGLQIGSWATPHR